MNPQNDPTKAPVDPAVGLSLPSVDPSQIRPAQVNPLPAQPSPVQAQVQGVAPSVVGGQQTVSQPTSDEATPMIADDSDLIEKEWVEKAKQLVDHTKNDPYTQNKEINKFKAVYIKKRYNKDIQLSKD